jgi:alanine racemase
MADLINSRPIRAVIHTEALRHNLGIVRRAARDAKIWAVVKANAYGHGVANVYEGLRGADGFACLDLTEAQTLRSLGWRGPILLLEGAFNARDLEWCSRLNLWHVIHTEQQIEWLAAHKTNEPQRVFLKLNSGMNRLGFPLERYRAAYVRLSALPQVDEISHLTHFSDADTGKGIAAQWNVFQAATKDLDGERSVSNSAGGLLHPEVETEWLRAGIALYGSEFVPPQFDFGLKPAMTLAARIVSVQNIVVGDSIGYGSGFIARHDMRIGTVACGYADGYPRHASSATSGAPVLVDGTPSRTLGRISMDMLCVDLSDLPNAGIGSTATLWGRADNGAVLAVDSVAHAAGTISYELLCAVAPRVSFVLEEN